MLRELKDHAKEWKDKAKEVKQNERDKAFFSHCAVYHFRVSKGTRDFGGSHHHSERVLSGSRNINRIILVLRSIALAYNQSSSNVDRC